LPIKKLKATQQKPKSSDTDSDIVVQADKVQTEKPREAGPVHVGHHMWLRLGMDLILKNNDNESFDRTCLLSMTCLIGFAAQPMQIY
jgi:hypothetical protein